METEKEYRKYFEMLSKMYFSDEKKYEFLGILLGQMDLDLFIRPDNQSESADPVCYIDYCEIFNRISENTNEKEIGKVAMKELLQKYSDSYEMSDNIVMQDLDKFL